MKKIDELLIGAKCHLRQLIFGKQPGIDGIIVVIVLVIIAVAILAVTEDGIFKIAPDKFSKSYELQDINYAALTNSEKRPILERWGNLIRSLRCANLKVTIYTGYIDEEEARQKILYPWQKEELKDLAPCS